jgi:hypothetical protein
MARGATLFLRHFGIFTLLILGMWLFGGAEIHLQRGTTSLRADLLSFLYPLGAATTGALFGLLQPLGDRSRPAAMATGVVAIVPWMAAIGLTMDHGYADWTAVHTFITIGGSLPLGCALGYGYSRFR